MSDILSYKEKALVNAIDSLQEKNIKVTTGFLIEELKSVRKQLKNKKHLE